MPQRRRQQQQQQLLSDIDPGDEILTVGGLYGIVHEIDEDDDLVVEIAEGIRVRIARRAVGAVVKPDEEDGEDGEDEEGEDDVEGEVVDGAAVAAADTAPAAVDTPQPAVDEAGVKDSKDLVNEGDPEGTGAAARR